VLDLARRTIPPNEAAALLDAVGAASRSACGVQRCILVRLTDGRIKVIQALGWDLAAQVDGLVRRYGPVSAAYFVEPSGALRGRTRVSDLIHKRSWRQSPHGWAPDEPTDQPRAAGLSRNAAIFAASLGMSTGALPKVDTIFTSPGAFS
jgi:hypothetical protein